mmetsp:Transcript_100664/g.307656  ORF Transcript_100664/g.307656 Transcript_100664/m.307656 type:complete len:447 (+) Transcript_100664:905-2245(+)
MLKPSTSPKYAKHAREKASVLFGSSTRGSVSKSQHFMRCSRPLSLLLATRLTSLSGSAWVARRRGFALNSRNMSLTLESMASFFSMKDSKLLPCTICWRRSDKSAETVISIFSSSSSKKAALALLMHCNTAITLPVEVVSGAHSNVIVRYPVLRSVWLEKRRSLHASRMFSSEFSLAATPAMPCIGMRSSWSSPLPSARKYPKNSAFKLSTVKKVHRSHSNIIKDFARIKEANLRTSRAPSAAFASASKEISASSFRVVLHWTSYSLCVLTYWPANLSKTLSCSASAFTKSPSSSVIVSNSLVFWSTKPSVLLRRFGDAKLFASPELGASALLPVISVILNTRFTARTTPMLPCWLSWHRGAHIADCTWQPGGSAGGMGDAAKLEAREESPALSRCSDGAGDACRPCSACCRKLMSSGCSVALKDKGPWLTCATPTMGSSTLSRSS